MLDTKVDPGGACAVIVFLCLLVNLPIYEEWEKPAETTKTISRVLGGLSSIVVILSMSISYYDKKNNY